MLSPTKHGYVGLVVVQVLGVVFLVLVGFTAVVALPTKTPFHGITVYNGNYNTNHSLSLVTLEGDVYPPTQQRQEHSTPLAVVSPPMVIPSQSTSAFSEVLARHIKDVKRLETVKSNDLIIISDTSPQENHEMVELRNHSEQILSSVQRTLASRARSRKLSIPANIYPDYPVHSFLACILAHDAACFHSLVGATTTTRHDVTAIHLSPQMKSIVAYHALLIAPELGHAMIPPTWLEDARLLATVAAGNMNLPLPPAPKQSYLIGLERRDISAIEFAMHNVMDMDELMSARMEGLLIDLHLTHALLAHGALSTPARKAQAVYAVCCAKGLPSFAYKVELLLMLHGVGAISTDLRDDVDFLHNVEILSPACLMILGALWENATDVAVF